MVRSHRELAGVIPGQPREVLLQAENKVAAAQKLDFNVSDLNDDQIHNLLHLLREELHSRALESGDPEVLGLEYLTRLNGGEVERPEVLADKFIGLGGLIKYNTAATKHSCVLYSINMPGSEPFWAWEDNGTLAFSQSTKVGDTRQSVALHIAVDGMQFIRHTMKHDGDRHIRLSENVWDCVWSNNGEGKLEIIRSKTPPRNLPIPNH